MVKAGAAKTADVAVVGGGLVGSAIAFGLVRLGLSVVVLDEGDVARRASRGNFGLVWVQGKGLDFPAYAHLTGEAADDWPGFAETLIAASGVDPMLTRKGGFNFCFSDAELLTKQKSMARLSSQTEGRFRFETLDRDGLRARLPWIGPSVAGAIFTEHDGGANPLALLRGLHTAITRGGGAVTTDSPVSQIEAREGSFAVTTRNGDAFASARLVLAAGLGNAELAPMIGLEAPVRPVRGQILVTERIAPFLSFVTNIFRQMPEGTCLIGDTNEEVGMDTGVLPRSLSALADRAIRVNPALRHVGLVRSWGALRVMSPDGLPIYERSSQAPGAWLVTVHSGVTLAPAHTFRLAGAIAEDRMPAGLEPFSASRFRDAPERSHMHSH